jgi:acetyl-CoA acyltransferase
MPAELIAQKWNLSREELDEFAAQSHSRAAAAQDAGWLAPGIVPVPVVDEDGTGRDFVADEGIRRGTSVETLAALQPVFATDGRLTAGSSSQISDGAAALLITTSEIAQRYGWKPLARFHSFALSGVDPQMLLTGPIPATEKILKRSGLSISDIGHFEINEAFASIPLAWQAEFGADPKALNPFGGAIALGHPLGASGAQLTVRMLHGMVERGTRYGLQAMCEGGGTANATILELL